MGKKERKSFTQTYNSLASEKQHDDNKFAKTIVKSTVNYCTLKKRNFLCQKSFIVHVSILITCTDTIDYGP